MDNTNQQLTAQKKELVYELFKILSGRGSPEGAGALIELLARSLGERPQQFVIVAVEEALQGKSLGALEKLRPGLVTLFVITPAKGPNDPVKIVQDDVGKLGKYGHIDLKEPYEHTIIKVNKYYKGDREHQPACQQLGILVQAMNDVYEAHDGPTSSARERGFIRLLADRDKLDALANATQIIKKAISTVEKMTSSEKFNRNMRTLASQDPSKTFRPLVKMIDERLNGIIQSHNSGHASHGTTLLDELLERYQLEDDLKKAEKTGTLLDQTMAKTALEQPKKITPQDRHRDKVALAGSIVASKMELEATQKQHANADLLNRIIDSTNPNEMPSRISKPDSWKKG